MTIKMLLKPEYVEELVNICNACDFDVNVLSGRVCVDGRSLVGVTNMCNRVITLAPVTYDDYEVETFFRLVEKLGAFKEAY